MGRTEGSSGMWTQPKGDDGDTRVCDGCSGGLECYVAIPIPLPFISAQEKEGFSLLVCFLSQRSPSCSS